MISKKSLKDDSNLTLMSLTDLASFETKNNLKSLFREIRDYFAGNVTGITRDESIAQNIMRLLFCKMFEEVSPGKAMTFEELAKIDDDGISEATARLF